MELAIAFERGVSEFEFSFLWLVMVKLGGGVCSELIRNTSLRNFRLQKMKHPFVFCLRFLGWLDQRICWGHGGFVAYEPNK